MRMDPTNGLCKDEVGVIKDGASRGTVGRRVWSGVADAFRHP